MTARAIPRTSLRDYPVVFIGEDVHRSIKFEELPPQFKRLFTNLQYQQFVIKKHSTQGSEHVFELEIAATNKFSMAIRARKVGFNGEATYKINSISIAEFADGDEQNLPSGPALRIKNDSNLDPGFLAFIANLETRIPVSFAQHNRNQAQNASRQSGANLAAAVVAGLMFYI